MVSIQFLTTHDISIQLFLNSCSDSQLHEIQLLLNSNHYANRMYPQEPEPEKKDPLYKLQIKSKSGYNSTEVCKNNVKQ